jgi:perosamine synthetase
VLVDCDPVTLNVDLDDAERRLADLRAGRVAGVAKAAEAVGIMPVHVGGLMLDAARIRAWAGAHGLWVVEDAAHSFPAAFRASAAAPWTRCGENTADVTCFSFYANKTITTGEGGMAVTDDETLAQRMRLMSLHGLSNDAWSRYSGGRIWDYRILAPGFKYNLTDLAAAVGLRQLARAEEMRARREEVAVRYREELAGVEELDLPPVDPDRLHSWHLFPIRLRVDRLAVTRNEFLDELRDAGIGCSVHWRPLHLHPYYQETFGWAAADLPVATAVFETLVSLPIFPTLREDELASVVQTVSGLCRRHRLRPAAAEVPRGA